MKPSFIFAGVVLALVAAIFSTSGGISNRFPPVSVLATNVLTQNRVHIGTGRFAALCLWRTVAVNGFALRGRTSYGASA
jgi:hypothetical protein